MYDRRLNFANMVIIDPCNPHQLNAYPTVLLVLSIATSVRQTFAFHELFQNRRSANSRQLMI